MSHFQSLALAGLVATLGGCAPPASRAPEPTTSPTHRIPTQTLLGNHVPVYPLTYVAWDSTLRLDSVFTTGAGRRRVDSILFATLRQYGFEVRWVPPDSLRRAARQAPGLLENPDDLPTSQLRVYNLQTVPEPLRAHIRTLTGATTGGRHSLVPAGLSLSSPAQGRYIADFTIVLVDTRLGIVWFSNTFRGFGDSIWDAVAGAARILFP
jgi:hypothetical protein